ncbi:hypothetical protein DXG01_012296 [Tephrocybe rancida]|nr:hypothetical protein DXG01_012296 [Tephrocybe rancida]
MNDNDQPIYGLPATDLAEHNTPALLPLARFAQLHLQHIISHPPDSVLFPFMHGLEGNNDAQNTFFSSSPTAPAVLPTHHSTGGVRPHTTKSAKVPRYRGLTWVVCEDDLEAEPRRYARELSLLRRRREGENGGQGTPALEGDSESGGSSDFDDDEEDEEVGGTGDELGFVEAQVGVVPPDAMDIDDVPGRSATIHISAVGDEQSKDDEKHMHPVIQRPSPIQTVNLPSSYSSASSGLSTSLTTSDSGSFTFSPLGSIPTPDTAPLAAQSTSLPSPNPTTVQPATAPKLARATGSPERGTPTTPELALLTCTFRPSEILRPVEPNPTPAEANGIEGWEFVPAKVPDGISLRNFGIQVPIYTTISDIVVYSPKGPTPNALILARRLQEAIRRKYEERAQRLGGVTDEDGHFIHPDLLHYNVFILDSTAAEMYADSGVPHLVMRLCGNGVPGAGPIDFGSKASNVAGGDSGSLKDGASWGAYTDGPDGHIANMEVIEGQADRMDPEGMYVDVDTDMDLEPGIDADVVAHARSQGRSRARARDSNTVDFARREKEEMRDLTKASEIISVPPPDGMEGHANHVITPPRGPPQPPSVLSIESLQPVVWAPHVGQVFLGNSDDVPLAPEVPSRFRPAALGNGTEHGTESDGDDPFNYLQTNDPAKGFGYDICIECHDLAPFPTSVHLKAAEEHLTTLDDLWVKRVTGKDGQTEPATGVLPPRPPPNANAVIHLPFPSSPSNTQTSMNAIMPVIRFLEKWLMPVVPPPPVNPPPPPSPPPQTAQASTSSSRRWSSVTSLMPYFPSFPLSSTPAAAPPAPIPSRTRSFTSPPGAQPNPVPIQTRTRPIKVLLYSADGYTESSVPALCLLMAVKRLSLPEAYLELQVTRRRSFFVYQADIGILRRVESRLREDAERSRVEKERLERERERERVRMAQVNGELDAHVNGNGKRVAASGLPPVRQSNGVSVIENGWRSIPPPRGIPPAPPQQQQQQQTQTQPSHAPMGRPAAKSVSFGHGSPMQLPHSSPLVVPSSQAGEDCFIPGTLPAQQTQPSAAPPKGRPRANTSPWLPSSSGDHQSWFNDPRFDGSFPSRVLPFLYLGNLNHAANVFMLHALGITHVVSVGECALIPPPHHVQGHGHYAPSPYHHPGNFLHGRGVGHGSLWHEEREGRIKVLDIKGVCDDGIDTLEPQLEPICDWIDQARVEGGQVLVHCRVGVSRSATVTLNVRTQIAYVMKHLGLPLVDAYLIVRSRRLSVLIQPNMRLLYNLCGWEIKLAKTRAGENEENLRNELARTLSWPYLAKEVHALNEKYLH